MDIRLADVTAENWRAVIRLELDESQKALVASNLYSIAQSKFDEAARPRAIYAGDDVVGFLMYDILEHEDGPHEASIYRFMIDRRHQRQGYGRAALRQAIDQIRKMPGLEKISICYMAGNAVAQRFYASFGFVEIGAERHGEQIAELAL